ncbi:nitric oxide-associated protein 1-like [Rhopilema esculentum]|uniref:nitric oxide-associated protein 1-like n=1 Tax=Rhopilema esculentum TaxID=499914 RepID=UPI0031E3AD26
MANRRFSTIPYAFRSCYQILQTSHRFCYRNLSAFVETKVACLHHTNLPIRRASHGLVTREHGNIRIVCSVLSKNRDNSILGSTEAYYKEKLDNYEIELGYSDGLSGATTLEHPPELSIYVPSTEIAADEFTKLPLKCRSCGAFMQTQDTVVKGYISPKKLPSLLNNNFEELICSNCYFLKYANKSLNVGIDRDNVYWQFSHMVDKPALILYIVDLMDMTGSVLPEIMDLIGKKKNVIVVGNKLDMLPSESDKPRKQEHDTMKILRNFCLKEGLDESVLKDVCLVSGLTGYGIEKLVVLINKHREVDMNLYVVGSTNVGKSTIFNVLQNLCSISKDANIPTQAITHYLPGTTSGLVRHQFAFWRMKKVRRMFLEAPPKEKDLEETQFEFVDDIIKEVKPSKFKDIQSDSQDENSVDLLVQDGFSELVDLHSLEKEKRWMYDTPALMNSNQITQFLTHKELKFLKHRLWVVPRTFIMKPGRSLLLGGLARIDYCSVTRKSQDDPSQEEEVLKASQSVFLTVFCSNNIPIHPTSSERAESMLERNYGNHLLKIPFDDVNRQGKFPALEPKNYEMAGAGWERSVVDLCIAGLGWIAVTAGKGLILKINLYTPKSIGQQVRDECLMPNSVTKRGERGVRYAGQMNRNIYECTRKGNPQLIKAFDGQNEITNAWFRKIEEKQKLQRFERKTERQRLLLAQGRKGKMRELSEKVDFIEKEAMKLKELEAGKQ